MSLNKKLLIILNDDLSEIVKKGEVIKRYYNPKNFFQEVHYLLINQKFVSKKKLRLMSGNAKVCTYYLSLSNFEKLSVLFNVNNLNKFLKLIYFINPSIIRCYNIGYSIFLANIAKRVYKIPYIISLHCDYIDIVSKLSIHKKIIFYLFYFKIKKIFKESYKILPVYSTASKILKKMKLINYEIYYNFIGKEKPIIINKKEKY